MRKDLSFLPTFSSKRSSMSIWRCIMTIHVRWTETLLPIVRLRLPEILIYYTKQLKYSNSFYFQHLLINISSLSVFEIFNEFLLFILNKSDNSPIEHARKSPNLRTTRMSHGVTNPFIGAFRYTDMLKSGFLSLTIQSEKNP